jgi:energy-converting hydrogenase Eha subunit B
VLASDRRRRSAVKAWWAGVKLLWNRKLATLGTYAGITLAGLALAAVFAIARLNVPALGVGGFIAAFVLTQLAVVSLAWMRSARLFAMLELVRAGRS